MYVKVAEGLDKRLSASPPGPKDEREKNSHNLKGK